MFYNQSRDQLRQVYVDAWRKFSNGEPLQPVEAQIADVIAAHPEYHALFEQGEVLLDKDYQPEMGETNPFLHMGLHLGIREQIVTNRPAGIAQIHQSLVGTMADPHAAEHTLMECLAEMMWQAQRTGSMPDEATYLACLQERLERR